MAESVPENSEGEPGEQGRSGGLAVGLSGRPIYQIKAPKIRAADKAPCRLGNLPLSSNYIYLKKGLESEQREEEIKRTNTKRPGCAPCLSSPCPWSFASARSPLHLSIRSASGSPRTKPGQCADGCTDQCCGTDGGSVSAQLDTTTPWSRSGEEKVPWWQPAVCPAWHGEPRSRTSTSTPPSPPPPLSHRAFFFLHFILKRN